MKKILFYTANGVGLGHLRRSSFIAEAILKKDSKAKVFFVSMCSDTNFLQELNIPFLKLQPPTDNIIRNQKKFLFYKKENEKNFENVLLNFKPDIIVLDIHVFSNYSFPQVLLGEKYKSIKKILIYRLTGKDDYLRNFKIHKNKFCIFNKIIVPHAKKELSHILSKEDFDVIKKNKKIIFSGSVYREVNRKALSICRKKYNIKKNDFIVTITLGGGGELILGDCETPSVIISELIKNSQLIKKTIKKFKIILITGPLFQHQKIMTFLKIEFFEIIHIEQYEKNLLELYKLSNLIICPIGYNTGNEILKAKIPAILFPLRRGSKNTNEQLDRARYLETFKIVRVFDQKKNFKKVFLKTIKDLSLMKTAFNICPKQVKGNNKIAEVILNI